EADADRVRGVLRALDREARELAEARLLPQRLDRVRPREVARGVVVQPTDQLAEAAAVLRVAERRERAERRQQAQDQRLAEVRAALDDAEVGGVGGRLVAA